MSIQLIVAFALIPLLMAGGAALIFSASRFHNEQMASRLGLISQYGAPPPRTSTPAGPDAEQGTLVRRPGKAGKTGERAALLRICRRLKISDQQAPGAYVALRAGVAAVLAVVVLVVLAPLLPGKLMMVAALVALIGGYIGWVIPSMVLDRATAARTQQVESGLPEALELLVVCVEAGLALEDAIDRVTGELHWSSPALAEEFALTSADLKILPDRDRALGNLAARIDTQSVRSVVTALSQTLRYGTPLAQALRSTAAELRNDALLRMEERANQLPPLLTLPMMLFIMPTIFLVIGGPAVLRVMDVFSSR